MGRLVEGWIDSRSASLRFLVWFVCGRRSGACSSGRRWTSSASDALGVGAPRVALRIGRVDKSRPVVPPGGWSQRVGWFRATRGYTRLMSCRVASRSLCFAIG
jgi:hypothetical protein